jgi:hypothetical protein
MRRRKHLTLACAVLILLAGAACTKSLDEAIADLNARATQVASGGSAGVNLGDVLPTPGPSPTPGPASEYNLALNPNASLADAWEQVYALNPGTEFTITATEQQVAAYIIHELQATGWADNVRGGSATIGVGQIRLDLALIDTQDGFGAGTATFQPTLDASARVQLNPQGTDLRGLVMPGDFTAALGDAVLSALTGPESSTFLRSEVRLSRLSFENGRLSVSGTAR